MIRTLKIQGFKSINDQTIELGRVNCLIGDNGVGKSNLLEAIGVLSAAAYGIVDNESLMRRGVRTSLPRLYKSSFSDQDPPKHIHISVEGENEETYQVSLKNPMSHPKLAWIFIDELLKDTQDPIVSDKQRRNKKNLNTKAGLAALKLVELEPTSPAAQLMQCLQEYAIYCPNTPTLRNVESDAQPRNPVGLNGGQLAEAFAELRKQLNKDNDEVSLEILDTVLDLISWSVDIDTVKEGTKSVLKFTDRFMNNSRNKLTAGDASEGALYVLFYAALCLLPNAPHLFAIDNLDQSLNPRLAIRLTERLSDWLKNNTPDRQILFTVHNPAILDGLDLTDPEIRLFAIERDSNGMTCVRRIELSECLLKLNQEYPLSRLWLMGRLGAVPNV
ncbi:AAA family ATPase [Beggiatoa leptomitoformis]|uniref:AAA family ATPase n=1 Tax=Beggiatoa leptomitoformis TaxID=288004 RepID=A0A2N9YDD0_9GAMM|nr:ATP-binding protein [Beggiatoa leptomitoformis]ALG69097.1 AAA family ATPase [Beggiatoa leptomitoformis]AUI68490.1 AAA family ATPase [Beggiatoa leptomitoformis]